MRLPPREIEIPLESNPLISRILVRRLAVIGKPQGPGLPEAQSPPRIKPVEPRLNQTARA